MVVGAREEEPGASQVAQLEKNPPAVQETWVRSLGGEEPLEKEWQPAPVFLPGEFHGQRSLAGYSPQGCKSWTRLVDYHQREPVLYWHFFFFHKTCYILLPQLGMEPMPPAVEAQSLNHWTTREVPRTDFILFILIHSQK